MKRHEEDYPKESKCAMMPNNEKETQGKMLHGQETGWAVALLGQDWYNEGQMTKVCDATASGDVVGYAIAAAAVAAAVVRQEVVPRKD